MSSHDACSRLSKIAVETWVVSYDNERGKGDHRHLGELEEPYTFTTVEQLVADFLEDVRNARGAA